MSNDDLYTYLHAHTWPTHPSVLNLIGIAVFTEWRPERHGVDRFPSHAIGANGIPAATTCGELSAAMVRQVYAERTA